MGTCLLSAFMKSQIGLKNKELLYQKLELICFLTVFVDFFSDRPFVFSGLRKTTYFAISDYYLRGATPLVHLDLKVDCRS